MHEREKFWRRAQTILLGDEPWPERKAAMKVLVEQYAGGFALVEAGGLPACDDTWVSYPLPQEERGYRCFLKHWDSGEETGIHGHPNTMFVYLISAQLESMGFQRTGDTVQPSKSVRYGPGETMTGCADNEAYDNFIHQLRCTAPGWSLHIYSDSGSRGIRFGSDYQLEDAQAAGGPGADLKRATLNS